MSFNIVLFDDNEVGHLRPFTYLRSAADIRVGALTIAEKWKFEFDSKIYYKTNDTLQEKYELTSLDNVLYINSRLLPSVDIVSQIKNLSKGEGLAKDSILIAYNESPIEIKQVEEVLMLKRNFDIFSLCGTELIKDFNYLIQSTELIELSDSNKIIGNNKVYIAKGAKAEASFFNTTDGPIFIDKDSEVMEGCMIRGPFYLGQHSTLKMGAKIYSNTSIGPHCKVGGEINNSVFFGYSNKAHDGFIGNSVIGEWCNIGADSNNSNLKNNYEQVKLWNYNTENFERTGLQFCGLVLGDHSKCGINTMFNTGTVVGISANIFGSGFPRNFIPSFSWGGASGFETYTPEKAYKTANLAMERRGLNLSEFEKKIMQQIFKEEKKYRSWENS